MFKKIRLPKKKYRMKVPNGETLLHYIKDRYDGTAYVLTQDTSPEGHALYIGQGSEFRKIPIKSYRVARDGGTVYVSYLNKGVIHGLYLSLPSNKEDIPQLVTFDPELGAPHTRILEDMLHTRIKPKAGSGHHYDAI